MTTQEMRKRAQGLPLHDKAREALLEAADKIDEDWSTLLKAFDQVNRCAGMFGAMLDCCHMGPGLCAGCVDRVKSLIKEIDG